MDPDKSPATTTRPPRLLDLARDKLRTLHYSYRTEQQYLRWVRRFFLFHDQRHPRTRCVQWLRGTCRRAHVHRMRKGANAVLSPLDR